MTRWIARRARSRRAAAFHRLPSGLQDDGRAAHAAGDAHARARGIALGNGLQHVYTGNVHDPAGQVTTCTACASALIAREGYHILDYRVSEDGRCTGCGQPLAGRFGRYGGSFGARRIPVRLAQFAA